MVLACAGLLARQPRDLKEALALILIGVALMFDPTFFNNNFLTIYIFPPATPRIRWAE